MMRERRVEPDAPAPRRERARITARAQPAAVAPAAPAPVSGTEQALVSVVIAQMPIAMPRCSGGKTRSISARDSIRSFCQTGACDSGRYSSTT